MASEMDALLQNDTWTLVPYDSSRNILGASAIEHYKACLVAKGFHQLEDHDYYETFTAVVKSVTIGILLTLEALHHWVLRQLDVQNAFLHVELQERESKQKEKRSKDFNICFEYEVTEER
ncbi:uncharacterized mitochondrial protein AtMg00820-like [Solanum lycopersicum]|uniref:uncharacterized mitochondrial protein AtMg00820-like n=1 Tax=Solanum lycopersicum TaxID=4081 RepID=UPI003747FD01